MEWNTCVHPDRDLVRWPHRVGNASATPSVCILRLPADLPPPSYPLIID